MNLPTLPPPGKLLDVGSHHIHLYSLGEGTPVVVLENGAGESILSWWDVQSEIAKFTQVVSYDRSGLGWSERGGNPRTGANVVQELHTVLTTAKLPPPYILVGHSMGGVHIRMFRQAYPELVAGMIMVDSSHEQQVSRFKQYVPAVDAASDAYLEKMRELLTKPYDEFTAIVDEMWPLTAFAPELAALMRDRRRPETLSTQLEEYAMSLEILDQPDGFQSDLGDLPLRVLTQTTPINEENVSAEDAALMLKVFQELQTEIAKRSTRGTQTLVANSGHYIQRDQPQIVIDTVREMVELVRQGSS